MTDSPGTAHWFAVFCKPRQEHKALVNLERQDFECFLPMALNPYQKFSRRNEDRTEPLFPRYLFLRAVPQVQNLAAVRSTRRCENMRFTVKTRGKSPASLFGRHQLREAILHCVVMDE